MDNIDTVRISRVEEIIDLVKRRQPLETDPIITFEFMISSLFPRSFQNIMNTIKDEHTKGYMQRVEEENAATRTN